MIHETFNLLNWLGSEWVLMTLILLSVLVVAIAAQRWMEIKKLVKQSNRFWAEVGDKWFSGGHSQWKQVDALRGDCQSLEIDTLDVVRNADSNESTENIIDAYLEHRRLKLEKNVGILGTIGANAAFLGLLGTVIGIIRAFNDLSARGLGGGVESVGAGIAEALVATAVGLCVAIPAIVFFNLINRQIGVLVKKAQSAGVMAMSHVNGKKRG